MFKAYKDDLGYVFYLDGKYYNGLLPEELTTTLRYSPEFNREITQPQGDNRTCTCHPDDNPPVPCARKYAFSECVKAATAQPAKNVDELVDALKSINKIKVEPVGKLEMEKVIANQAVALISIKSIARAALAKHGETK